MNKVMILGNLTRDPEKRVTATGKSLTTFSVAVNKRFKRADEAPANFFKVRCWGQVADYVYAYASKGKRVVVEGSLEQNKFTGNDGVEKDYVDILATEVSVLDRARGEVNDSPPPEIDEYDPFADE